MTSSTIYNASLSAPNGRLNGSGSWSSKENDQNQWIQIDLGGEGIITAIASQSRKNSEERVESYNVSYSLDEKSFAFNKIDGVSKVIKFEWFFIFNQNNGFAIPNLAGIGLHP